MDPGATLRVSAREYSRIHQQESSASSIQEGYKTVALSTFLSYPEYLMSKLQIGIVGLPHVGKSTLFNALTKKGVPAENYPFCTIDPSVGIVPVPDERLEKLSALSHSEKKIPTLGSIVLNG